MTVSLKPWAIDGNTHPAADARVEMCAQLGGTPGAFVTSTTATDGAHGVCFSTDLKVTQNGTPDMNVIVSSGSAYIRSGQASSQAYHARNDANVLLAVAAADPTNARKDLVILQVRDANFSGSDRDARLFIVTGTPSGSPADPSLASFPNCLVLARIDVPALDTAIGNAQITDLRVGAQGAAWWQPRGAFTQSVTGTPQTVGTSIVLVSNVAVTINAIANRAYKVTGQLNFRQRTSAGLVTVQLFENNASTVILNSVLTLATDEYGTLNLSAIVTPAVGSRSYRMRANTSNNTADLHAVSGANAVIIVEDVGAVIA